MKSVEVALLSGIDVISWVGFASASVTDPSIVSDGGIDLSTSETITLGCPWLYSLSRRCDAIRLFGCLCLSKMGPKLAGFIAVLLYSRLYRYTLVYGQP